MQYTIAEIDREHRWIKLRPDWGKRQVLIRLPLIDGLHVGDKVQIENHRNFRGCTKEEESD